MHVSSVSKEEFLNWLAQKAEPSAKRLTKQQLKKPPRNEIVLIWQTWPARSSTAPLIAIPEAEMISFYAFTSTYISTFRPFSAFFRVVPYEKLGFLLQLPESDSPHQELPVSLVGIAIAEAYVQSRGRVKSTENISVSAVLATLSATLASAIRQGYSGQYIEEITRRWWAARQLNSDDELALKPNKTSEIWAILVDALSQPNLAASTNTGSRCKIVSALKLAREPGYSVGDWLHPLTARVPSLGNVVLGMQGAREERVHILENAIDVLLRSDADDVLKEFLAGALLSMFGNGSYDFLPLSEKLINQMPSAALWFAVVSSVQKNDDALTTGNCLGRRTARDIFRVPSLFEAPRDDISLEELEVYRHARQERNGFRSEQPASISVGLLGNVSGKFRSVWSNRAETPSRATGQLRAKDPKSLAELHYLLDRAKKIVGSLSDDRQKDLFDPDSNDPRRKR